MSDFSEILDKLPYSDGAVRRRIVAGGLFWFLAIAIYSFQYSIPIDTFVALTKNLGILLVASLVVYATGSVIEMLGEYFFARIAAGLLQALRSLDPNSMPVWRPKHWPISYRARGLWGIPEYVVNLALILPSCITLALMGLFGRSVYRLENLDTTLQLPASVLEGLREPAGRYANVAFFYFTNVIPDEEKKKWSKSQLNRARDISIITTTVLLTAPIAVGTLLGNPQMVEAETRALTRLVAEQHTKFCGPYLSGIKADPVVGTLANQLVIDCQEQGVSASELRRMATLLRFALQRGLSEITWSNETLYYDNVEWIAGKQRKGIRPEETSDAQLTKDFKKSDVDPTGELFNGLAALAAMLDDLSEVEKKEDEIANLISKSSRSSLMGALAVGLALLLLYTGYFASLDNAIRSILKALEEFGEGYQKSLVRSAKPSA